MLFSFKISYQLIKMQSGNETQVSKEAWFGISESGDISSGLRTPRPLSGLDRMLVIQGGCREVKQNALPRGRRSFLEADSRTEIA